MSYHSVVVTVHVLAVAVALGLFVTRFYWLCCHSPALQQRWVKVLPHINDTLLLASGIALIVINRFYPFSAQESWLTAKLFGVIIYILLGHIALGRRQRSLSLRWVAFILALVCFFLIAQAAITKLAFLME
ncbi:SirB2 family protein [Candidatus Symbiopectobacterium sp. NZEC151]|uniref:SirB2 family protein n=1 Tax=Candidatus Symbiopectobacterium sp. NZEC151 TaxID=2820470 RepID=UPI00222633C5|nr:SirB2 family protein [Candidatus Symbiopectobacterium sp. NZEC151]MCW2473899.1 SirB2 family protein [Candidatus Symbiopectobacterium sp. NZEC151]